MHRQHMIDDRLHILQQESPAPDSPHTPQQGFLHSGSDSDTGLVLDIGGEHVQSRSEHQDEDAPLEPPPPYEQSLSMVFIGLPDESPPSSNPFLRNRHGRSTNSLPPQELQHSDHVFEPTLLSSHSPSAPPLTLLATMSARPGPETVDRDTEHAIFAPGDEASSTSSSSAGRRPVRIKQRKPLTENESVIMNGQGSMPPRATSPESPRALLATSSRKRRQTGYTASHDAPMQELRTPRRLEHKQAFARHAASAPELHTRQNSSDFSAVYNSAPVVPLSQAIVPAPPPRLLQFRSRDPSSVPACPFLLCQKPIAFTKTRRERGVTVWIVCGLLFFCNTYWTTQAVISQFSSSEQGRVLSEESLSASSAAASRFTIRMEAAHLFKGFLGFKTHRYKDPVAMNYQRHVSDMKRPTIATVGVLREEQSALRIILTFTMMAIMAIIRWWLCLTPLLARPLFDTVHSCPHPHPYPYPEELELEREQLKAEEREMLPTPPDQQQLQPHLENNLSQKLGSYKEQGLETYHSKVKDHCSPTSEGWAVPNDCQVDEQRISNSAEAEPHPMSAAGSVQEPALASEGSTTSVRTRGRFNFFRRIQSNGYEHQQPLTAMAQSKKKRLSWKTRRALRKAEERRRRIIKASQDIGRFSLLYELGSFFMMDHWKQTVLAPGKILPDAYED